MKIAKNALGFNDPVMILDSEGGDFLPLMIILYHNDRKFVYKREELN